ncbi:hypothetical protein Baya_1963 [Bagarius yarrelli]|uniref:Uncharacterized protein n=1 Tax=Bagarius yarrelli TaxID=175774 RepID=A0A556TMK8_BAGYA|nr:hypothetical protein Baya_1963 [Bagarius yarrelli]
MQHIRRARGPSEELIDRTSAFPYVVIGENRLGRYRQRRETLDIVLGFLPQISGCCELSASARLTGNHVSFSAARNQHQLPATHYRRNSHRKAQRLRYSALSMPRSIGSMEVIGIIPLDSSFSHVKHDFLGCHEKVRVTYLLCQGYRIRVLARC